MDNPTRIDQAAAWLSRMTILAFLLYGALITFVPILPFWVDEWFVIENLKFRSTAQLWHTLDRVQQFPRVYLQSIKALSAACDYSYTSLRLPSFLAHSMGILLLYRLSSRLFERRSLARFTWILIYISFNTSIHYFAQVKQYTIEMTLSLVAIWQLHGLMQVRSLPRRTYVLLCLSFARCTFFSYTYPIVLAPVYLVVALHALRDRRIEVRSLLPLGLGLLSIATFYLLDVRQVLADKGMQNFWQELILRPFSVKKLFLNPYLFFCQLGSGDLFGNIFGVAGVAAFLFGTVRSIRLMRTRTVERDDALLYCSLVLWLMLALFIAGKLPLGTFRLNAFAVAATAYLIVRLLQYLSSLHHARIPATAILVLMLLSSTGNICTTVTELIASPDHDRKLLIYNNTATAIQIARREHLPIYVTPTIAYPFDDRWQGDWILRTHPAYKIYDPVPVIAVPGDQPAPLQSTGAQRTVWLYGDSVSVLTGVPGTAHP